ncbi:LysR family transcriptional regulator [Brenneria goodwinii]|uniref:LysR family transcriptional regulator n=1 Tax=Brenneria goodwinii TaxID=1109412 RepID=A0A0G4K2V3_9GAMM|nr:LysR family transcriptional regulator [Brenneria goodwinii]ATA24465.1 LysR family transcriptional regulator [Brenneria goodwinii]MCG8158361.1 LysR family transcriptional regulator [Brenneria goodwinii]MCG8161173.1 LysR family transcriptional regulator [Brenneria goodwinii]MCG8165409.1 LysR family transcriptional regulator [Brenneria goodwinii]MCG8169892.1 LysR family transcriptional regulator [Brenneria goodwinii]
MKMQLLYEFIQLSDLLNFSRAAQKMNITQPVLSRHMKALEEQFGAELFRRDTHSVELTSTGKLLCGEARKIIQQYESSVSIVNAFTGKSRRRLTITYLGEAIQHVLVELLTQFQRNHPDIMVECRDSELDEALFFLEDHTCDLGFLVRPNFLENKKFSSLPFQTDSLCAVVNKHHPLAGKERVSLREVSQWPIIRVDPREFLLSEEYSTRFFDCYGIAFNLDKEYPNLKTCCFNLEFREQVALVMPKHRGYLLGPNCVLLEIMENDYWFNLELVWDNKNTNPCIPLFLNEFKVFFNNKHLLS